MADQIDRLPEPSPELRWVMDYLEMQKHEIFCALGIPREYLEPGIDGMIEAYKRLLEKHGWSRGRQVKAEDE